MIIISTSLIGSGILSGCTTKNAVTNPPVTPIASATATQSPALAVPASCIETKMLTALKKTVPRAKFIDTAWTPAKGSELADVLNNSGIACSFGIQSAGVGLTVMWVKD